MHGGQVMDALIVDKALGANLGAPSISHGSENLYMRGPLEEATRENLSKVLYRMLQPTLLRSCSVTTAKSCITDD